MFGVLITEEESDKFAATKGPPPVDLRAKDVASWTPQVPPKREEIYLRPPALHHPASSLPQKTPAALLPTTVIPLPLFLQPPVIVTLVEETATISELDLHRSTLGF